MHVRTCTTIPIVYYCTLHLHTPLQEADADGSGNLSFEEFAALFKELSHRPEIEVLFTKYASSHDYMTPADLRMFSMGEQSACPTLEECQKLVEVYEPTDEGKSSGRMSLDGEQEGNIILNEMVTQKLYILTIIHTCARHKLPLFLVFAKVTDPL